LHVAGRHFALVTQAIAVLDGTGEHVRDRLDPAMRMPRESGQVITRVVVSKIVEEQKRVEVFRFAESEARCSFTPAPSIVGFV
jgi:hypothetical protein